MSSKLCVYHANCLDGTSAAWAVRKAFPDDDIEFLPTNYGDPVPDAKGRDVIVTDFSFSREGMKELSKNASSLLLIDHHKTAQADLLGLENELSCPSEIIFDMSKSGCELTWDRLHPGVKPPKVLANIGDGDLWKFDLPFTREIRAYGYIQEHNFSNWEYFMDEDNYDSVVTMGSILVEKMTHDIEVLMKSLVRYEEIAGYRVPVANAPAMFASELGNKMCVDHDADFSAVYFQNNLGEYRFSLRSRDGFVDVSEIARKFGGGGHRNASGFASKTLPWEKTKNELASSPEMTDNGEIALVTPKI